MPDSLIQSATDRTAFRKVMGLFTTGVCVVSIGEPGAPVSGITVNSFVSVSLEPMLVSWSIQNASSQFAQYAGAKRFAISILTHDQEAIARRYAARGTLGLLEEDFERSAGGLPIIRGALGHIECLQWSHYEAGDHTMIFGEVQAMEGDPARRPLAFFGGHFSGLDL